MRHRVYGKHLNRNFDERNSLFRSLLRSLILHESLVTTQAKYKAIKGLVDKIITASKSSTPSNKKIVLSSLASDEVIKKLTEKIAPRYNKRQSGYVEVVRLGRRLGDGSLMVKMILAPADEVEAISEKKEAKSDEVEEVKTTTQKSKAVRVKKGEK